MSCEHCQEPFWFTPTCPFEKTSGEPSLSEGISTLMVSTLLALAFVKQVSLSDTFTYMGGRFYLHRYMVGSFPSFSIFLLRL